MTRLLKKSFSDAMLECVESHTEAPDSFIAWSCFSVLGAVMKRKFFIQDGLFTIYPNQYIILVSPPGVGKGTAINFVWKLVREGPPGLANYISDRVTAPKIIERIANGWNGPLKSVGQQLLAGPRDHSATIFSTELSQLLGASEQMLDFLCEAWDRNEYDYDTKTSGSAFIKGMATSLIGATVPDHLRNIDKNRNMSIKGGFTSRCLFIYEDVGSRFILHPPPIESNASSMKMLADLKNDVLHIASLPGGEYCYTPAAQIHFDRFISAMRTGTRDDTEIIQHFKARIRTHILKLAMVVAISRHDGRIIDDIDMTTAIAYVNKSLLTLEKVFRGSGDSDLAGSVAHVQNYLDRVGAASRKDMLKNLYRHMNTETLDRVLYTLSEIGYLHLVTSGNIQLYKISPTMNGSKNGAGGKKP